MAKKNIIKSDGMDYPSNSKTKKPNIENKKVEKVIKGNVVKKKKTLGGRFKSIFLSDDIESVSGYILYDIIIPSAKDMLYEVITGGAKISLFGDSGGSRTRRDKGTSYVNYSKYYYDDKSKRGGATPQRPAVNKRASHNFDDIVLESRGDAEEVLSHLVDLTMDYGMASVGDLYDLVNLEHNFTDDKYGWDTLESATVVRVRDGYMLSLPKTRVLD